MLKESIFTLELQKMAASFKMVGAYREILAFEGALKCSQGEHFALGHIPLTTVYYAGTGPKERRLTIMEGNLWIHELKWTFAFFFLNWFPQVFANCDRKWLTQLPSVI